MGRLLRATGAVLLAAALALTAGCGEKPREAADISAWEAHRIYTIELDADHQLAFDREGNELPAEGRQRILCDKLTGQPRVRTVVRYEDTGERNEYGGPVGRTLSQLWDLEGNLLYDWTEGEYGEAFGDYLIRRDSLRGVVDAGMVPAGFKSTLWNYRTGEDKFGEVCGADAMGDGSFLLSDVWGRLLGIADGTGKPNGPFPIREQYLNARPWNGYTIAALPGYERYVLLRPDFTEVLSADSLGSFGTVGAYLVCPDRETDGALVLSVPEGKEVLRSGSQEGIPYFDGELAVIVKRSGDGSAFRLQGADGALLADGFVSLEPDLSNQDRVSGTARAEQFIGVRDGKIELIDREGKTLYTADVTEATDAEALGGGRYTYEVPVPRKEWEWNQGLLDEELRVLIPAEEGYQYISKQYEYACEPSYDLLMCSRRIRAVESWESLTGSNQRVDIRDMDGKPLVSNLSEVFEVGENRLAVLRGFDAGLMDWEGNWIVKRSIFDRLADD